MKVSLQILPGTYAMFKVENLKDLHSHISESRVYIASQAEDEISIVCEDKFLPANYLAQSSGWKLLKFIGSLDDNLIGTVSMITLPLAKASISLIVNTTYDSGYFGVQSDNLQKTIEVLTKEDFKISGA